ncbi:polysaccharide deacetylase family protein [Flavobacterium davisii]|uniref:Polysaccharide deacetylase family protein n=1 Tax=Flavobacterium columnare TaxID=996 RepID=A0A8G0KYD5_9FLAO|nr:polysaccharide deacetylase family protein [Flavobacterium davisii]QYS90019.1 polysaccharide deacetylase family protein [Flavobacterium davisii]
MTKRLAEYNNVYNFKISLVIGFLFAMQFCFASNGPDKIAKIDRALWPYPINSAHNFDVASKCEMIAFSKAFKAYEGLNETELQQKLDLKKVSVSSVREWETKTKQIILSNFKSLTKASLQDLIGINEINKWEDVAKINPEPKMPSALKAWYHASLDFYDKYLYEQCRLASLYPRITSEIGLLSKNEINGFNLSEKQFLLTFDDGPTIKNGNTDKMIKVLNEQHQKGVFFVLGDALQKRMQTDKQIQNLYQGHLLASHGKTHVSHQKLVDWKTSLNFTSGLIQQLTDSDKPVYFRPPYGQRTEELAKSLGASQSKVVLWNIDSQDWNAHITAREVADRQISLMLLWRRGILLFHDVHEKAQIAVPHILNYFKGTGIQWVQPNEL